MWTLIVVLLVQALAAPDPAQMEKAPDLGYRPVPHGLQLPEGVTMGAASGVEVTRQGHLLVFNRGPFPLLEFDRHGAFVRSIGEGRYVRPHGFRLDPEGNLWTTDVNGHTVTKMSPAGEVLLTMGTKGQPGEWNEAANTRLLNEPTDLAFGAAGELYVLQGHGRGEPRVLKFDKAGKLTKSWGGQGTGPGQFDTSHSIVVDAKGLVYVADRQNRRVQIFDADGTYLKEWKYAGLPCGLYIGPGQQMYMVSGYAGQILRLDVNGRAVGATGQPGKQLGEFGEAHYMAMGPEGEIYVADTIKPALHKFVKK
jgi:DNA-binding beta-propeller fold protein YncE